MQKHAQRSRWMRYRSLLLLFLFSLLLCMAAGCARYQDPAGSVRENIPPGPTPSSGPSTPGDQQGKGTEPGPLDTVSPVTPERTAILSVITSPQRVTTSAMILTTLPTTIPTPPEGDIPHGVELAVWRLTNEERASNGVAPLAWDDALAVVARSHSTDMAEHHFFSHTNLQGEGPTERAARHGYLIRKDLGGGWYSEGIGENINQMPTGNVVGYSYVNNDAESIARAAVKAFMDSPGHRALILKSEFSNLGVGTAYDGTYYSTTQNFW